jgi:hypothetical protein
MAGESADIGFGDEGDEVGSLHEGGDDGGFVGSEERGEGGGVGGREGSEVGRRRWDVDGGGWSAHVMG